MITVITPTVRPEGLELVKRALANQEFKQFEHIIVSPLGGEPDTQWTLNREYNRALACAKGDLIVTWQDYTYARGDTLQRFWNHYADNNRSVVSGVGNKYKLDDWKEVVWRDPRADSTLGFHETGFFNIEFNLAALPKDAFYDVGGFDEDMDHKYGMDGYSVVQRLHLVGDWEFYLDQKIKSYSLEHGRPDGWEENNWIHSFEEKEKQYVENPRLLYLE